MIALTLIAIGVTGVIYTQILVTISIEDAHEISERYLDSQAFPGIEVGEVMEFTQNYYVVFVEDSTGVGAFEMLVDKQSGRITPEYGPNMMWNTKYGHGGYMHRSYTGTVTVTEAQAVAIAQKFLDEVYPGSEAEEVHPFYGYYTIHTAKDGEVTGMLSVNQYDGSVWYHNWHGEYIQSLEAHQDH